MSIPLPNLDDRRWADLVEEGRALIPLYAPAWTDHNAHDPGITLIELLAWIAEMDIFQVNRVSDAHRRKFLALVGIVPEPPQPARTVVAFTLRNGSKGLALPATTELSGVDPAGRPTRFRTLEPLTVIPAAIEAVLCEDESGLHDVTAAWRRGGAIAAFGTVPTPGAALYVGLDGAVAPDDTLQVVVRVAGPRADADERRRLIEEAAAAARGCIPPAFDPRCAPRPVVDPPDRPPPHHGAITVWEVLAATPAGPAWRALEVDDDTRALTLDGRVRVRIPAAMARARIGRIETTLHYLRCRFSGGAVDTPPLVAGLFLNAVEAEQSVPLAQRWTIAKRAVVPGPAPRRGARILPRLRLDEEGQIAELRVDGGEERGGFTVLDHRPGWAAKDGTLALEAVFVGTGTGMPHQRMTLAEAPVEAASFGLFTLEADGWRTWDARADFAASRRADAHFVLDPSAGTIAFGDGEAGRVPPTGAVVFATGRTTRAEAGNLAVGRVDRLADSIRNAMLFDDLAYVALQIATVSNPVPAEGGRAAETIAHAIGRAIAAREAPARAVTARDYEALAMATPSVRLARAAARGGLHPSFDCVHAPGAVTVIIVPDMPGPRPTPSSGLRRAVAAFLQRRRLLGTRVAVVGPRYVEVGVRARVRPLRGVARVDVRDRIVAALDEFLHPLRGGPDGAGWPFGRDVYRAEIMQVIDEVAGVDHVESLDLVPEGCGPQCGNVCLRPTWLTTPGRHEIEVV